MVIFDCDGTLVDSQNAIVAAMEAAFKAHGLEPPLRTATLSIVGLSLIEAVTLLYPGGTPAAIAALAQGYRDAFSEIRARGDELEPMFPGAREVVAALAERKDVALGIATGKSDRGVRRLLKREGWKGLFHTIQTSDHHPSKPHPSMIEAALAETRVGPEAAVMVGDTTFDIEMGLAAGVTGIGVSWGYHPVPRLEAAGACLILGAFPDLLPWIDRLARR
ncbi:MAG: HAD-IA family hydrolase, partial [Hyphomicrobiaceae bacterium]